MRTLRVPSSVRPMTVLAFLKAEIGFISAKRLFRARNVRVNGRRVAEDARIQSGDEIVLYGLEPSTAQRQSNGPVARPIVLPTILFENQECLVLDKPSGIAVHEAPGVPAARTLLPAIEAYGRQHGFHAFLVHRLDAETSGCLVVAKGDMARDRFLKLFRDGEVDKEYAALCFGIPQSPRGKVDTPLPGRDGHPVTAVTLYAVQKAYHAADVTLLRVRILTGRMHQIRKHLSLLGHPVVLDAVHGNFALNKAFRKAYGLKRLFLHAAAVRFPAATGETVRVVAPLPADLRETLERLAGAGMPVLPTRRSRSGSPRPRRGDRR